MARPPRGLTDNEHIVAVHPASPEAAAVMDQRRPNLSEGRTLSDLDLLQQQESHAARLVAWASQRSPGVCSGLEVTLQAGETLEDSWVEVRAGVGLSSGGQDVVLPRGLHVRLADLPVVGVPSPTGEPREARLGELDWEDRPLAGVLVLEPVSHTVSGGRGQDELAVRDTEADPYEDWQRVDACRAVLVPLPPEHLAAPGAPRPLWLPAPSRPAAVGPLEEGGGAQPYTFSAGFEEEEEEGTRVGPMAFASYDAVYSSTLATTVILTSSAATLAGATTTNLPSGWRSRDFNGQEAIEIWNTDGAVTMGQALTLECWVKVTALGAEQYLIQSSRAILKISATGAIVYQSRSSSGWLEFTFGSPSLVASRWTHIAISESTLNGVVTAICTLPSGSVTLTKTGSVTSAAPRNFRFGKGLQGSLCEVRIFGGVRTSEEIAADRFTRASAANKLKNLLAAWPLTDSSALVSAEKGPDGQFWASTMAYKVDASPTIPATITDSAAHTLPQVVVLNIADTRLADQSVTWSSSDPNLLTVAGTGRAWTMRAGTSNGTATLTLMVGPSSQRPSWSVQVDVPAVPTALSVSTTRLTLRGTESTPLPTVTALDKSGQALPSQGVTWAATPAEAVTLDSTRGTVQVRSGDVLNQDVVLRAQVAALVAEVQLRIDLPVPTTAQLEPTSLALARTTGEPLPRVVVTSQHGAVLTLTPTWTATGDVQILSDRVVPAAGKTSGSGTLTATVTHRGVSLSARCPVTLAISTATRLAASSSAITLRDRGPVALPTVSLRDQHDAVLASPAVSWALGAGGAGLVSLTSTSLQYVGAPPQADADITLTGTATHNAQTFTCAVTVSLRLPRPASVQVNASALTVRGDGEPLPTTQITDQYGAPYQELPVTWELSAPGIVDISGGRLVPRVDGALNLTARCGPARSSEIALTVRPAYAARLVLPVSTLTLTRAGFVSLPTVTVQDSLGVALPGVSVSWAVVAGGTGQVDVAAGAVRPLRDGLVSLRATATHGGRSASVDLAITVEAFKRGRLDATPLTLLISGAVGAQLPVVTVLDEAGAAYRISGEPVSWSVGSAPLEVRDGRVWQRGADGEYTLVGAVTEGGHSHTVTVGVRVDRQDLGPVTGWRPWAPSSAGLVVEDSTGWLTVEGDQTLECWAWLEALGTRQPVIGRGVSRGGLLWVEADGALVYTLELPGGWGRVEARSTPGALAAQSWAHVAVCRRFEATGGGTLTLFVNGQLAGQAALPSGVTNAGTQPGPLWIGRAGAWQLRGRLCEARVWSRVRTAQELVEWRDDRVAAPIEHLVACWPLDGQAPGAEVLGVGVGLLDSSASSVDPLAAPGAVAPLPSLTLNPDFACVDLAAPSASLSALNSGALDLGGQMTVEAHLRVPAHGTSRTLWAKGPELRLTLDVRGLMRLESSPPGGSRAFSVQLDRPLPAGQWVHIAAVRDATRLQLIVDGDVESSRALPSTLSTSALSTQTRRTFTLSGGVRLAELRVWSLARTPSQLRGARNRRLTAEESQDSALQAYWRLDDGRFPAADRGPSQGRFPLQNEGDLAVWVRAASTPPPVAGVSRPAGWPWLLLESGALLAVDGDAAAVRIPGDLTLECWVRPNETSGPQPLWGAPEHTPEGALYLAPGGLPTFVFKGADGAVHTHQASATLPAGAWVHLAAVRSASDRTVRFTLNGAAAGSSSWQGGTQAQVGSGPVWVGGGSPTLRGGLAELRVWAYARTQRQLQDAAAARLGGAVEHLRGRWALDGPESLDHTQTGPALSFGLSRGTWQDMPTQAPSGGFPQGWSAAWLDGSLAELRLRDPEGRLRLLGSMTLELWVYLGQQDEGQPLYGSGAWQGSLEVTEHNQLQFSLRHPNGRQTYRARTTSTLAAGQWYHIAVVRDMDKRTVNIAIQGDWQVLVYDYPEVLPPTDGSAPLLPFDTAAANPNDHSVSLGSGTGRLKGAVAEVRVWSTARTLEQLRGGRLVRADAMEAALVAWWPLQEPQAPDPRDENPPVRYRDEALAANRCPAFDPSARTRSWTPGEQPAPAQQGEAEVFGLMPSYTRVSRPRTAPPDIASAPTWTELLGGSHPAALRRNLLAWRMFEGARHRAGPAPWDLLGVPVGLLVLQDGQQAPDYIDRHAVVRPGGRPQAGEPLVPGGGEPGLHMARVAQLSEHLAAEPRPPNLAAESLFRWLPPFGILPTGFFDLAEYNQLFFPITWTVDAAPVPLEQLERVARGTAGLGPLDTAAEERVRLLIPVPERLYEPELLLLEELSPTFLEAATRAQRRRGVGLRQRALLRARARALLEAIEGPHAPPLWDHPDPGALEPMEEPDPRWWADAPAVLAAEAARQRPLHELAPRSGRMELLEALLGEEELGRLLAPFWHGNRWQWPTLLSWSRPAGLSVVTGRQLTLCGAVLGLSTPEQVQESAAVLIVSGSAPADLLEYAMGVVQTGRPLVVLAEGLQPGARQLLARREETGGSLPLVLCVRQRQPHLSGTWSWPEVAEQLAGLVDCTALSSDPPAWIVESSPRTVAMATPGQLRLLFNPKEVARAALCSQLEARGDAISRARAAELRQEALGVGVASTSRRARVEEVNRLLARWRTAALAREDRLLGISSQDALVRWLTEDQGGTYRTRWTTGTAHGLGVEGTARLAVEPLEELCGRWGEAPNSPIRQVSPELEGLDRLGNLQRTLDRLRRQANRGEDLVESGMSALRPLFGLLREVVVGRSASARLNGSLAVGAAAVALAGATDLEEVSELLERLESGAEKKTDAAAVEAARAVVEAQKVPNGSQDRVYRAGIATMRRELQRLSDMGLLGQDAPTSLTSFTQNRGRQTWKAVFERCKAHTLHTLSILDLVEEAQDRIQPITTHSRFALYRERAYRAYTPNAAVAKTGQRSASPGRRAAESPALELRYRAFQAKVSLYRRIARADLNLAGLSFPGFLDAEDLQAMSNEEPLERPQADETNRVSLPLWRREDRVRELEQGLHDPVTLDADEGDLFIGAVECLEHTVGALRVVEGVVEEYQRCIAEGEATLRTLQSELEAATRALDAVEDHIAEARHDLAVSRALMAEEQERVDGINRRRLEVLRDHVPFLAFHRARTVELVQPRPTRPVEPGLVEDPVLAAWSHPEAAPSELDALMERWRDAPCGWLDVGDGALGDITSHSVMLGLVTQAKELAQAELSGAAGARPTAASLENGSVENGSVEGLLAAWDERLRAPRLKVAALQVSALQRASVVQLRGLCGEALSSRDLLTARGLSPQVSRRVAELLGRLHQVAGAVYEGFSRVESTLRLDWSRRFSLHDRLVDLRELGVLPGWPQVGGSDSTLRQELQTLVDWLYQQIDDSAPLAVHLMHDTVRLALVLACRAPVHQSQQGIVAQAAVAQRGVLVQVDVGAGARVGMSALVHQNGRVVAQGVVQDLQGSSATVRVTMANASAALQVGDRVQLLNPDGVAVQGQTLRRLPSSGTSKQRIPRKGG